MRQNWISLYACVRTYILANDSHVSVLRMKASNERIFKLCVCVAGNWTNRTVQNRNKHRLRCHTQNITLEWIWQICNYTWCSMMWSTQLWAMSNNKLINNWWVCPRLNFESEHEYECEYYYVFMTFTEPLLVSWWTGKMKSKGAYTTKLLCLINFYLSSMTTWIPTTLAIESDDERNSRDYFLHTLSIFIDFILYRCW